MESEGAGKPLVELAVRFLRNPRVSSSSDEQKKAFLKKKGLTDEQVDRAFQIVRSEPPNHWPASASTARAAVWSPSWKQCALIASVVGGAGILLVKLFKSYVLPWINGRRERSEERLENIHSSVVELHDSIRQSLSSVCDSIRSIENLLLEQKQQMQFASTQQTRCIEGDQQLKSEIVSLKGLLLGRHQFPPTRNSSSASSPASIPPWQRAVDAPPTPPPPPEEQNHEKLEVDS